MVSRDNRIWSTTVDGLLVTIRQSGFAVDRPTEGLLSIAAERMFSDNVTVNVKLADESTLSIVTDQVVTVTDAVTVCADAERLIANFFDQSVVTATVARRADRWSVDKLIDYEVAVAEVRCNALFVNTWLAAARTAVARYGDL